MMFLQEFRKTMADVNQQLADFATAVSADLDAIGTSLDEVVKDTTDISAAIDKLMASQVSPATFAALDALKTRVDGIAGRVSDSSKALDAVDTKVNPPAPAPVPTPTP